MSARLLQVRSLRNRKFEGGGEIAFLCNCSESISFNPPWRESRCPLDRRQFHLGKMCMIHVDYLRVSKVQPLRAGFKFLDANWRMWTFRGGVLGRDDGSGDCPQIMKKAIYRQYHAHHVAQRNDGEATLQGHETALDAPAIRRRKDHYCQSPMFPCNQRHQRMLGRC